MYYMAPKESLSYREYKARPNGCVGSVGSTIARVASTLHLARLPGPCLRVSSLSFLAFSIFCVMFLFSSVFAALVQDPTWGERGRLEKFVGDKYAPVLTKKPVKAVIIAVFGIIFVSYLLPHVSGDHDSALSFSCLRVIVRTLCRVHYGFSDRHVQLVFFYHLFCRWQVVVVAGSLFFFVIFGAVGVGYGDDDDDDEPTLHSRADAAA